MAGMSVDISDDAPAVPDRLDTTIVPLCFTSTKAGAGVTLTDDGKTAASDGKAVGSQLADAWMAGGRNPLVWTCAIALEEVSADTLIGIAGRNYFPTSWGGDAPLAGSTHAVVLRCGDGKVTFKGKTTSFILKPLTSGDKLNLTMDMQVCAPPGRKYGRGARAGGPRARRRREARGESAVVARRHHLDSLRAVPLSRLSHSHVRRACDRDSRPRRSSS